ncbi:hypothetical protein J2X68_005725 [Streptomyces sp. 3330]|uniref:hypothetical protein n=1 Tax=Streptomyces sp. 3330 TaxID=2817755 RepID=UPI00285A37D3|nr:hypothetical protein [Streptomyces sp. 3330]MDR6978991.1 hypothetical protein [Streptomyces sp. 3330]
MPRLSFRRPPGAGAAGAQVLLAESALVERYADLVRLAYLVLPPSMGRHRRVLAAHGLVQRALPGGRPGPVRATVPAPRRKAGGADAALDLLRVEVLRTALARARRPRRWPARLATPADLVPRLPFVVGLRLFPRFGGVEEMVLGQALAGVSADARAVFVLRRLDGLPDTAARELLRAAGSADVEAAVRAAARLDASAGAQAATALAASREFDACTVQARPTDLLRRRRRVRLAGAAGAAVLLTVAALTVADRVTVPSEGPRDAVPARSVAAVPRPVDLVRTPPDAWARTSRVDFTAWPARGARTDDEALLARALTVWARPPAGTRPAYSPATAEDPPPASPRLLYAGDVGDRAVVLLFDGMRLARYGEPLGPEGPRTLDVSRADDADVTTAAAVAVDVRDGATRYLLAPWVAEARTRDLSRPNVPARPLTVARDGLTAPVPTLDGDCAGAGVLQLRSSSRIVEDHAFLLAGLGGLSPVHLTYTPLPVRGAPPARQPREATGPAALSAWSRLGCGGGALRGGGGVRAVNAWDFAEQRLPDGGGTAVWTCSRADTWRGVGDVRLSLRTAGAPARAVASEHSTAACSRFGQHIVVGARWRSPAGRWYLLAAGSRAVTGITVTEGRTGGVSASVAGRTLAVPAPRDARFRVTARLATGGTLDETGHRTGRR